MQIIKAARNRDYMTVANYITRDPRVSLKARGLFLTVMALPENWHLTVQGLSTILKEGRDAVQAAMQELTEHGYCVTEDERDESGRFAGVNYIFMEKPAGENNVQPQPENPDTGKPDTGKPITENRPQLNNTKNKETKELKPSSPKKGTRKDDKEGQSNKTEVPSAIQAIRAVTARYPDKAVWPLLVAAIGENPDIERLADNYMRWRAKGFSPTNYSWVTEWYAGSASLASPPPAATLFAQESIPIQRLDYPLLIEMQRRGAAEDFLKRELYEEAKKSWLDHYETQGTEIYEICVREVATYETSQEFTLRFPKET